MKRYLLILSIIYSCTSAPTTEQPESTATEINHKKNPPPAVNNTTVLDILNNADSVIIASHYSPNEPVKDKKTGKYIQQEEIVKNDKLNQSIVQEYKALDQTAIKELAGILTAQATDDSITFVCFQPRNGIFAYKAGTMSYIDVCFECQGVYIVGAWKSAIIFDTTKYGKLFDFYKKHGFRDAL